MPTKWCSSWDLWAGRLQDKDPRWTLLPWDDFLPSHCTPLPHPMPVLFAGLSVTLGFLGASRLHEVSAHTYVTHSPTVFALLIHAHNYCFSTHQRVTQHHKPKDLDLRTVPRPRFARLCAALAEKAMALHSRTLAWKIPWMEEPGRLQSMGSLRVEHD